MVKDLRLDRDLHSGGELHFENELSLESVFGEPAGRYYTVLYGFGRKPKTYIGKTVSENLFFVVFDGRKKDPNLLDRISDIFRPMTKAQRHYLIKPLIKAYSRHSYL